MTARPIPDRTWVIRRTTANDLDAFRDFLQSVNLPDAGLHEQFGSTFLVAAEEDSVIGSAGLEFYEPYALLRSVAIQSNRRGTGIARALVLQCIEIARDRGVEQLYLLTETAETYFLRFGFEHIERARVPGRIRQTTEFANGCPASAVVMVLELAAARGRAS